MVTNVANLLHRSTRYLEAPSVRGEESLNGIRTLILIHAFPLSADMWLPQLARVPQGWRFVAPDIRGFRGQGPAFEDAFLADASMDDYADDVVALMDHLDVSTAAIAGLSMGGYVAMALAARAPERMSHLILADTRMAADTTEGRAGREKMKADVLRDGPVAAASAMLPKLIGDTAKREQPDLSEAIRAMILVNRAEGIAGGIDALKSRVDQTETLAGLRVPALVICGAEDTLTPPADAEAMGRTIPGAALTILPATGHLSNLEQPAAFNEALRAFLT